MWDFYIRRSPRETQERLGLVRPTTQQLFVGTVWIVVLVVLQGIAGFIWTLIDSSQAELLEGISSDLLGNMDTVVEWAVLAAATGTGEEILFRGALQPSFGLVFTSLLFATAHVQYGITPVTFVVFVIGLILGLIRPSIQHNHLNLCPFWLQFYLRYVKLNRLAIRGNSGMTKVGILEPFLL